MKQYYYVGQNVSHQAYGNGEVVEIITGKTFPVIVKFEKLEVTFTYDGKISREDEFPSLSQQLHVPLKLEEIVTFNEARAKERRRQEYFKLKQEFE